MREFHTALDVIEAVLVIGRSLVVNVSLGCVLRVLFTMLTRDNKKEILTFKDVFWEWYGF